MTNADDLDPSLWESIYITTRRSDQPDAADTGLMEVVVQGSLRGVDAEDWPIITRLRGYRPMRYAQAVITAAVQAQYEELQWRQLGHRLAMDMEMLAPMIIRMRKQRPVIPDGWTEPLRFTPIFGNRLRCGLVEISYRGTVFAQWSVEATRGHGRAVLDAAATAPLDATYYRFLRDEVGVDKALASIIVHTLIEERPTEQGSDEE